MQNSNHDPVTTDEELVARSLKGERSAYGQLVARHQAAACAVAYGICGDFHISEDAAQEAFVAAWKELNTLRETAHFRPWVCGIARNVARGKVRRTKRRGDRPENGDTREIADEAASPAGEAITGEESQLVWKAMDALEETYREPLILFYREQESVAAVASALELSEDAVKQRLSRGRALLREELAKRIEVAFVRTRPSAAFTAGVISALPPILAGAGIALSAGSAKAAGVTGTAQVTSGGIAAASAIAAPVASAVISVAGFFLLFRFMFSPHVPKEIRKASQRCMAVALGSSALFIVWVMWMTRTGWDLTARLGLEPVAALTLTILAFMALNIVYPFIVAMGLRKMNIAFVQGHVSCAYNRRRYNSPIRFMGLPLVSIAFGADTERGEYRAVAKGWIAIGETAYGFVACGSFCTGVIAVGGVSFGLISLGGIAVGAAAFGGAAMGLLACGGVALATHLAIGGVAVAHTLAVGGIAMAADAAFGGAVTAQHANDGAEWARLNSETSLGTIMRILPHAGWLSLLGLPGIYVAFREMKKKRM
jgi:RNA polymerase sigma factor (sigma-70 family)